MNSNIKPKPIQIRLPQEVEDSLRFVARKTRSTLNSVVIDCLMEHLPTIHPLELGLIDGVNPFEQSAQQLRAAAHDRLNRYETAVQLQLDVLLQLASLLNAQASNARSMQDGLRRGFELRVPEDSSGEPPDMRTERGVSPEILRYLDASRIVKNDATMRAARKQVARHLYEAAGEWNAVKELLKKLETMG